MEKGKKEEKEKKWWEGGEDPVGGRPVPAGVPEVGEAPRYWQSQARGRGEKPMAASRAGVAATGCLATNELSLLLLAAGQGLPSSTKVYANVSNAVFLTIYWCALGFCGFGVVRDSICSSDLPGDVLAAPASALLRLEWCSSVHLSGEVCFATLSCVFALLQLDFLNSSWRARGDSCEACANDWPSLTTFSRASALHDLRTYPSAH